MKTFIVIPCMDQVPAQFCQSLAMLKKEGECAIAFQMSSLIYMARNELAMKAIQTKIIASSAEKITSGSAVKSTSASKFFLTGTGGHC